MDTWGPHLSVSLTAMGAVGEGLRAITRDLEELAVLLFTSGTTGNPKGVMLSHRNLMSNVQSFTSFARVSGSDRVLLVLPLHHAFPLTGGLLGAMYLGASVVLESDVRAAGERMTETRPTIFFGVPALYETMLRAIQRGIDRRRGRGGTVRPLLRRADELFQRRSYFTSTLTVFVSPAAGFGTVTSRTPSV
jgi:long-subunit acyl-CoA synthetase (AMP-forming)